MKKIFIVYTIIGLILTPFIYANNAQEYRFGDSPSKWGQALGGAFWWPSYLFSIEPEVDGESLDSFNKSLVDIVKYRNEKMFTGKRSNEHAFLVIQAMGACMGLDHVGNEGIAGLYESVFSGKMLDEAESLRLQKLIMKKMDGLDFSGIVKEGEECKEELVRRSLVKGG